MRPPPDLVVTQDSAMFRAHCFGVMACPTRLGGGQQQGTSAEQRSLFVLLGCALQPCFATG